jgi:hypothetical protein
MAADVAAANAMGHRYRRSSQFGARRAAAWRQNQQRCQALPRYRLGRKAAVVSPLPGDAGLHRAERGRTQRRSWRLSATIVEEAPGRKVSAHLRVGR